MASRSSFFRKLLDETDLCEEPVPRQPVVELLGDGRVLIENHKGVIQYSTERIQTRVRFGAICVTGCNLQLRYMSGQKLVIMGRIDGIEILRGRTE